MTYKDERGDIVYYTDQTLYSNNKNKIVQNFQNSTYGFPNIGNSCYINSFLQILLHSPNFLSNLCKYNINEFTNDTLFYNIMNLSKSPYNSTYLYNIKDIMGNIKPNYKTFTPGESQSFGIDFLDKLIEECKGEESDDNGLESSNDNLYTKTKIFAEFCKAYYIIKKMIELKNYSNS